MSSRGRSVEKSPSKQTNKSGKSKSTGRSKSASSKRTLEKSVPSSSSKTDSQAKKRPRKTVTTKKSKSKVAPKASKEASLRVSKRSSLKVVTPNDPCVSGPDFYTNVLGPTADETILVGLETFMKFCQECPDKSKDNLQVDSGTGLSTKESAETTSEKPSEHSTHSEGHSTRSTPEKELTETELNESAHDISEKEFSGRSVSIKESPRKELSTKSPSRDLSAKSPSRVSEKSSSKVLSEKVPSKDLSKKESSKDLSKKGSSKDLSKKESSKVLSDKKSLSEEEKELEEQCENCVEEEENEEDICEDKYNEEPTRHLQDIAEVGDYEDFIRSLKSGSASSKIGASQTTQPSKHHSEIQTPSITSSQESQTDEPKVKHDDSQTSSIVESSSSQTSEHSLSNAESQTKHSVSKSSSSQSKNSYHRRSTLQLVAVPSKLSAKDQPKGTQDSSESCTCCPCTHCGDATSSGVCVCSSSKPTSKPSQTRRSCLKCKCRSTTSASSKATYSTTPQKRRVKLCCDCSNTPSLSPSPATSGETKKSSPMGDASESCIKIRYAITKITKFYSYTTFEVMRSTRKKPKVMPKSLEGVFVLKNSITKNESKSKVVTQDQEKNIKAQPNLAKGKNI